MGEAKHVAVCVCRGEYRVADLQLVHVLGVSVAELDGCMRREALACDLYSVLDDGGSADESVVTPSSGMGAADEFLANSAQICLSVSPNSGWLPEQTRSTSFVSSSISSPYSLMQIITEAIMQSAVFRKKAQHFAESYCAGLQASQYSLK
eukprot:CAMPEP_0198730448 /NCGR_PEP_ID=MMETSP1475-20131203/24566_1 /TAXON_ID= ORGANISM="Unidentified sp., Strain CCMP1999" /NCGR_SAMPLE_ID=MMETSP1475 /ASSEMBLY_ACC=CAM_ASM_001111 /LENGTH=149 /DNA_ID=CAMNT_0044493253 /DNA_START=866 /DNA_END=1316 /DNA_ORIENTATION=-